MKDLEKLDEDAKWFEWEGDYYYYNNKMNFNAKDCLLRWTTRMNILKTFMLNSAMSERQQKCLWQIWQSNQGNYNGYELYFDMKYNKSKRNVQNNEYIKFVAWIWIH